MTGNHFESIRRLGRFAWLVLLAAAICLPAMGQNCNGSVFIPCPFLVSVSPSELTAGVRQQRLTLVGSNFQPASRVLISLPNGDPSVGAPDVAIVSTTFVNSTTIILTVDVNRLANGLRSVDVYNPPAPFGLGIYIPSTGITFASVGNGASSDTTKEIFINDANSIAGPLQVQNIVLNYPRDGTILQQGSDTYGEAVIAGAGTGLATGVWLWDGNVIEQFTANLIGGESTTIRTESPLPTVYTGPHTLQVQITTPQGMSSRVFNVAVNGGQWSVLRLVAPRFGAVYAGQTGPALRWTLVPGAAKYQVGFSSHPLLDSVEDWHEVVDNTWRIPEDIWKGLPDGEIYWTVRSIDMSGQIRRAVPMRSLWHILAGALERSRKQPRLSSRGSLLLEWNALKGRNHYLVTITSDSAGAKVLRRYMTDVSEADLYAIQDTLLPNTVYYWQVQAFSPDHKPILTGQRQSFEALPTHARANGAHLTLVSRSFPEGAPARALTISRREPSPGTAANSPQPHCEVRFAEPIDQNAVALSVDGVDVTSMAEVSSKSVKYTPVFPLENGEHSVQVELKPDSDDWKFTVNAVAVPQQAAPETAAKNDLEAQPKSDQPAIASNGLGPEFKTHFGFDPQFGFSPAPNQLTMTGGEQMVFQRGDWKADFTGSGMLQALITPSPDRVFGRVQDYAGQLEYVHSVWGAGLRFGLLAPTMYTDAQFITTATARQAVEPKVKTPGGTFTYYANTNDVGPGGGDIASYHQLIRGAGYEAPLPAKWATLRLMWLNSRAVVPLLGVPTSATIRPVDNLDVGVGVPPTPVLNNASAITPPLPSGDVYGGLMNAHLPGNLELSGEYAISQTSPDTQRYPQQPDSQLLGPVSTSPQSCTYSDQVTGPVPVTCSDVTVASRRFGRAWRGSADWHWKKTKVDISYRDVTSDFSNPANPSLMPLSNPNRRGLNSSFTQGSKIGDFDLGYNYVQSNVDAQKQPTVSMHNVTWGWRKKFKSKTQFLVRGHDAVTSSGSLPLIYHGVDRSTLADLRLIIDQRDIGFNSGLVQSLGAFNLSSTVSRDWFRNSVVFGQNAIVTGTQFGVTSQRIGLFQIISNWSVSWAIHDRATLGATRVRSAYLLPTMWVPRTPMSVSPLISFTKTDGVLGAAVTTADLLSSQLGGRLSWRLPAVFRRATFSVEGTRVEFRDDLHPGLPGINLVDRRIGFMLSFAQDHTRGSL